MIGLPYSLPDHLCDLSMPPIGEINAETWLYRQLAIMTGRVIDVLQDVKGPTLAAALKVEEQLDQITAELPKGFLDLEDIKSCPDLKLRITRAYRAVHFYQLRTYIHLPLMLRVATNERYRFSLKSCMDDSRRLLEGYLIIFDTNPSATSDGSMMNLTAFIAAVVLLLGLLSYGTCKDKPWYSTGCQPGDLDMINRTIAAINSGSTGLAGALCKQCGSALQTMLDMAQTPTMTGARKVVLPYFGTVSLTRSFPSETLQVASTCTGKLPPTRCNGQINNQSSGGSESGAFLGLPTSDPGLSLDYSGPYMADAGLGSWFSEGWADLGGPLDNTQDRAMPSDWSWTGAEFPQHIFH
jgi:hypothetical protein